MKKEVVKEKISNEATRALDVSKVMAIAFAEVGAQGSPNYIEVFSDLSDKVLVLFGDFGYEAFGDRYTEDVDIEEVERIVPFLKWFRGTSIETTKRGDFVVDDEWVHLDARFGNHFFIRGCLLKEFLKRLGEMHICEVGITIMTDMLSNGAGTHEERRNGIIGAIVGDVAGSRFEFHNRKTKDFALLVSRDEVPERSRPKKGDKPRRLGEALLGGGSLLSSMLKDNAVQERSCYFTDDSVMTLAVADAIMKWREAGGGPYDALSAEAVMSMQAFGRRYPHAGYGGAFHRWLGAESPKPYNSWGNGAAMRVSACGWAGRTLDEVKAMSRAVTEVTHNHPEGIKGAEATAVATFLARTGKSKEEIKEIVVRDYYPLDFTLDEIRPGYEFDVSCQGSVPQALEAFFESTSFEDAIRNAISIGGDSDTIGAICGAVAGAFYGVPDDICAKAETFLDVHLLKTLHDFERVFA